MPTYRFRLQRVLDTKHCAEDRKKQDLAVARRNLDREESALLHLHSQGERCRSGVLKRPPGKINVLQEAMERARFSRLMRDIDRQASAVNHSAQAVAKERDDLLKCARECKVLESLREKGLLEYVRKWLRLEQKELDEVGRNAHRQKLEDGAG